MNQTNVLVNTTQSNLAQLKLLVADIRQAIQRGDVSALEQLLKRFDDQYSCVASSR